MGGGGGREGGGGGRHTPTDTWMERYRKTGDGARNTGEKEENKQTEAGFCVTRARNVCCQGIMLIIQIEGRSISLFPS